MAIIHSGSTLRTQQWYYRGFSFWRAETMKQFCMKIDLIPQRRANVGGNDVTWMPYSPSNPVTYQVDAVIPRTIPMGAFMFLPVLQRDEAWNSFQLNSEILHIFWIMTYSGNFHAPWPAVSSWFVLKFFAFESLLFNTLEVAALLYFAKFVLSYYNAPFL